MADKPTDCRQPKTTALADARKADRLKREAAALRANLHKRKDQDRARKTPNQAG